MNVGKPSQVKKSVKLFDWPGSVHDPGNPSISKLVRRKIRHTTIYLIARLMIGISSIVPRKVWLRVGGVIGGMSFYIAKRYQRATINNLSLAFPELTQAQARALAKEVFVMVGKNGGDVLRSFSYLSYQAFEKTRVTTGMENAERAHKKGKGVLFLTAHIGAFEMMATEMAFRGYKPLIVGATLKDPMLTNLVWKHRKKMGADVIERGKETFRLLKNLKSGGTMGILIDQDTQVKSVFVDFFGKSCATPVGAAMLALKTGAAVVPVFCHLNNEGMQQIDCFPEVEVVNTGNEENDIVVNTQNFTSVIEQEIRKYPSQWVWMHERWKTLPGKEIK